MMLNKNGFGYREMFFMTLLLFIMLLFASYMIFLFYNKLDDKDARKYYTLENELKVAAIKYSVSSEKSGTVTLQKLKEKGFITVFIDDNMNECDGYVIYSNDKYDSYIKCPNYTSENFDNKLLTNK